MILPRIPSDAGDVKQIAKSLTSKGYAYYQGLDQQAPFMLPYFALWKSKAGIGWSSNRRTRSSRFDEVTLPFRARHVLKLAVAVG